MTELRGNWEPERDILGWWIQPAERTCTLCRRNLHHTKAEHDLLYPADRATQIAHDQAETERQVAADNQILRDLMDDGMTEEQAVDELMRQISSGEGLVEPRPRP